jgi:hypothetical protein
MKKTVGILSLLAILWATPALAGNITAIWDANPVQDNILYYTFYLDGQSVIGAENIIETTITIQLASDTTPGQHYGTVTATNIDGESAHSNQAFFTYGKPGKPATLIITR